MGSSAPRQAEEEGGGQEGLPSAPRLPERAAIYIAPDGTVHFGALFEGLLPVARALGGVPSRAEAQCGPPPGLEAGPPSGPGTGE